VKGIDMTVEAKKIATGGAEKVRALEEFGQKIVEKLKTVYDPEIPVNIYDLGLIYALDVEEDGKVHIEMTLTAPGCPVAQTFPAMVEAKVREVPGVSDVKVELVWDPPWRREMMSERARLKLGIF
jgi:FeS assembly SUF system protein